MAAASICAGRLWVPPDEPEVLASFQTARRPVKAIRNELKVHIHGFMRTILELNELGDSEAFEIGDKHGITVHRIYGLVSGL
jgi:hypothetical protein